MRMRVTAGYLDRRAWRQSRRSALDIKKGMHILTQLFAPENAVAVSAWGFIIGLFSTVVGLVGFAITLRQIATVKTATEAAEIAITSLKIRMSHFDVIQECATAESALANLRHAARDGSWKDALLVCDQLATSLVNLKERYSSFDPSTYRLLDESIERVNGLSELTQRSNSSRTLDPAKSLLSLREIHTALVRVRFKIQEDQ